MEKVYYSRDFLTENSISSYETDIEKGVTEANGSDVPFFDASITINDGRRSMEIDFLSYPGLSEYKIKEVDESIKETMANIEKAKILKEQFEVMEGHLERFLKELQDIRKEMVGESK